MKTPPKQLKITFLCGILGLLLGFATVGHAATNTWTGLGGDNFWATAANWSNNVAPVAGNDLVFPSGAMRPSNTNNFPAGTTFNSITFSGGSYQLGGSNILLNAGINATNTSSSHFFFIPLTLNSNQPITTGNASVNFYLYSSINLNGWDLTFAGSGLAQVQSVLSGAGGLIKTGSGSTLLYASNTFSGPVQIVQGALSIYDDHALGTTNVGTTVSNGGILSLVSTFSTVAEPIVLSGLLNSATTAKTVTGSVTLVGDTAVIQVSGGAPLTINAVISGAGGFTKTFPEVLTLNATNTYTGTTTISSGTLRVNGSQPASPIALNLGTLAGIGTVGTITCGAAALTTISPGGSPGILTSSNLTLHPNAKLVVELTGTQPGIGYDQLKVNGSVNLSNATLAVTLGFPSAISNSFVIIDNDGADAVTNTFKNLPEGATANVNGTPFRVSYLGGDGNDVELTQLTETQRPFLSILADSAPNVVLSWPTNFTGFTLEANTNLNTNIWAVVIPSQTVSGTNNVVTNAMSGVQKYYRLRGP